MAAASLVALLLTVLIIPLLSFLLIAAKRSSSRLQRGDGRRLPPSPPGGLPLLGHLHLLGRLPHRALGSMAASCGPVMLLRLGQVPTVVASSAAAAEEAMKTRDLAFASRPRLLMADRLYYGTRDMVFAPSGERWRQLRRVCVSRLLSPGRVLCFRAAREQEVAALLGRVRAAAAADGAAVVNLSELLITYSNAVISRATFGDGSYGLDGDDGGGGTKLRKVFGEFEELLGTVPMAEVVPWLWPVDVATGLERKARRTSEEIDRLLERVIADHRRRRRGARRVVGDGEDDRRDFVDVLLDLSETEEEVGGVQLDTVTIKATVVDMLVAGTDTSYSLLEWAMAELINHPTQMRKLQDEIRAAVAGGVTEDDLPRLPYLKAVIKETLRLHPPGPLLLPRETLEDTELQSYHVPARTRVVINAWAIGRDPDTWGENAEDFMPERFAADGEAEYQKMGLDFRFLPFGAGRRGCPGVGFAVPANELALASLLYHFDWEVPGGGRPAVVDMTEVNGLAVRLKKALLLVAKPWPR
ncbi:hypothetical protein SETIT_5G010200v2 [Setaria italica]|uniref:Cytochrome P450 n=1 Tax=Setaria italica TaxID=4555 RepID=K3XGH4_SETIT|nr:cytochrome P450 71A1 [Setaria italica]RCV23489.1 hypothetical protein SETIT_5G010200v2 [Setaria italica]